MKAKRPTEMSEELLNKTLAHMEAYEALLLGTVKAIKASGNDDASPALATAKATLKRVIDDAQELRVLKNRREIIRKYKRKNTLPTICPKCASRLQYYNDGTQILGRCPGKCCDYTSATPLETE